MSFKQDPLKLPTGLVVRSFTQPTLETKIISAREIQKNYRRVFEFVKKTRQPIYIGSHSQPEVIILDVGTYRKLTDRKLSEQDWNEIFRTFKKAAQQGQKVNLAKFIKHDRQTRIL